MHILIVGVTLSGKSTLARHYVAQAVRTGIPVVVYDLLGTGWDGAAVHDNEHDFFVDLVDRAGRREQTLVVVDEADTILSQGHRPNWWLLLRGRHFGFKVLVLTQRPALVAPTVRGMCTECFSFQVSKKDAKLLADDYAAPDLEVAPALLQGQYLNAHFVNKRKVVDAGKVF